MPHARRNADALAGGFIHPGFGARPMHACSCSKAIAAFADESFQEEILSGTLSAYAKYTNSTAARLKAEFARIAKQRYAECDQEIGIGVSSVAAPVLIGHIGASFSVDAVGTVRRLKAAYRREVGEELIEIAVKISAAIQMCDAAQTQETDIALLKPMEEQGNQRSRQH